MKTRIYILIFSLIAYSTAFASSFSLKEQSIINDEAVQVVQNYNQLLNQIAAGGNINDIKSLSESLIDLFISRKAIIYNDLDPDHKLSEYYELETYVSNLILWYPDGMQVSVDMANLKASSIIDHGNDVYSIDLLLSKKISGNYLNRASNNNTEQLVLKVAFTKHGRSFENFKIAGIRNTASQYLANFDKSVDEVKAKAIANEDRDKIIQSVKAVINDYTNYLNLISDPKETAEDKRFYEATFTNIFANKDIKVFNDLSPKPEKNYLTIDEYLKNFKSWYSSGIKNLAVKADSNWKISVIPLENNKFFMHFVSEKFFSGKYLNGELYRDNSKYDFKIVFEADGKTFKNFKIVSIDKVGQDLFANNPGQNKAETPSLPIKTTGRRGWYVGVIGSFGLSTINDESLSEDPDFNWSYSDSYNASAGIDIMYFPFSKMGVRTGLSFTSFKKSAKLNDSVVSKQSYTDENEIPYNKNLIASFDTTLSLQVISIPLHLHYITSNPKKIGFFAELGITTSFIIRYTGASAGKLRYKPIYDNKYQAYIYGSYPDNGYYNRTNINTSQNIDNRNSLSISFSGAMGISIPFGYFSQLMIGPTFSYGLSNIASSGTATNFFGNTISRSQKLMRVGIFVSYSYKL